MTTSWDAAYTAESPAPWDIGRPQPAFARLADAGRLTGRVLDVGCGTGEHALLAARHGADATGVDVAPAAIERARAKAAQRGLTVRFLVGDALDLEPVGLAGTIDTVIDSGVFHVFSDEDRPRYVAGLASVLKPGGVTYLMCFSNRQPGGFGPRRVSQDELRDAFAADWTVESISADSFDINPLQGTTQAQAWLAVLRRG
ncbi:MAG TPA: class I SAM-dependent methyltransferase [Streptosporangiaceae bacterium]|nr:class I SAM-dependent methyltransferase [Streptosporangiaceae bacterium]